MSDDRRFLKLVRDRIPQYVDADCVVAYEQLSYVELLSALQAKLVEEALEYIAHPIDDELADVLEVVRALAFHAHGGMAYIEEAANEKAAQRGGFVDGIGMYSVKSA